MVIVEEGPGVTLVQKIAGAEKRVVFGRHFEFKKLPAQFSASTARWRTGQALYTALGDGELLGFERFVACFP
jgi:hypothetical protein